MNKIKEIISSRKIEGIADYFRLYRVIEQECKGRNISCDKTIRISIQSSFTINGNKRSLICEML